MRLPPRAFLASIVLVACTLGVYGQTAGFDFVDYDDPNYAAKNPYVLQGISWSGFAWAMTTTYNSNWHPLTWISLMLDAEIGGGSPRVFHLTNVALHVVNALLLLYLLNAMTGALRPSAFVAALFALHPLHVESVAWIAERKDVLSTLFWLLTLLAYVFYVKRPDRRRYALVVLCFVLGLASKPMLVTLPLVLVLLDFWPLGRLRGLPRAGHGRLKELLRIERDKLPLLCLSAASALVTLYAQAKGGAVAGLDLLPFRLRAANAVVSTVRYLGKMIWPAPLYTPYPFDGSLLTPFRTGCCAVVVVGISLGVFVLRRSRPYLIVGWLWYLVTLLPVIGLVQVGGQAMADRYTYVPLLGPFVMIAWGAEDLIRRSGTAPRWKTAACTTVIGATIVVLAPLSFAQVRFWRNSTALFTHTLAVSPENAHAHAGLGQELLKLGDTDGAIGHYREALRIWPAFHELRLSLADVLSGAGRAPEALPLCEQAVRARPGDSRAHGCLGGALLRVGRLEPAATELAQALRIDPSFTAARRNLGVVCARQGKLDEAIAHFTEVLRVDPSDEAARMNLRRAREIAGGG